MDDGDRTYTAHADAGPSAPSLVPAAGHSTLRPSHVSVPHQGVYVLELADLGQSIAVAYSSPHSALGLVDKGTLRETAALAGHTGAVSALAVLPAGQLLSASADASVLQWDPRARRPAATLSQGGHKRPAPLLSVAGSGDGVLVAAGSELTGDDAVIYFWDLRKAETPMYSHSSTHSDDIPTLSFHPSQPHLLLSASTDGLLSLTNALEADEDEAVVEVANWGVSVAKAGWAGEGGGRVWARSDMETVSLWDAELSLVHDFGDARRAAVAGGWATDYVVQCDFRGDDLQILAGSNDGSFSHICAPSTDRWALERTYAGGHSAIVRSVLFDRAALRVFSGGEDGALAAWAAGPVGGEEAGGSTTMEVDGSEEVEVEAEVDLARARQRDEQGVKSPGEHRSRRKTRYEPYGRHKP